MWTTWHLCATFGLTEPSLGKLAGFFPGSVCRAQDAQRARAWPVGTQREHLLWLEPFHRCNRLVLSIAGDMLMTSKNHLWLLLKVI